MGVRFNPERNEVYVANRMGGTVTVVDSTTVVIKHQIDLPKHPNSLALSPNGKVLYVSVKQDRPKEGKLRR